MIDKHAPLVTIILATYNRAHLLERAIKSVQRNTYDNFELIIIDDASTDSTEELVRQISDSRISYFRMPLNKGALAARNKGFDLARGQYVTILDDDDELATDALETVVTEFRKKRIDNFKILWFDCIDAESNRKSGFGPKEEGPIKYDEYVCGRLSGDFWMAFEKDVLKGKRFNEKLWGNESILWLDLHQNTKAYYIPKILCRKFRKHGKRMCDIENQIKYIPQIRLAQEEFLRRFGEDVKRLCPELYGQKMAYLGLHQLLSGEFQKGRISILKSMKYRLSTKYLGLLLLSFVVGQNQLLGLYSRWISRSSQV